MKTDDPRTMNATATATPAAPAPATHAVMSIRDAYKIASCAACARTAVPATLEPCASCVLGAGPDPGPLMFTPRETKPAPTGSKYMATAFAVIAPIGPARATPAAPAALADQSRADLYALACNALVVPLCAHGATPEETDDIRAAGRRLTAIVRELRERDVRADGAPHGHVHRAMFDQVRDERDALRASVRSSVAQLRDVRHPSCNCSACVTIDRVVAALEAGV